jgi:hypothetical protein
MIGEGTLGVIGILIVAILVVAYVIIMILLPIYVAGINRRVKLINMKFDRIIEILETDIRREPDKFTV